MKGGALLPRAAPLPFWPHDAAMKEPPIPCGCEVRLDTATGKLHLTCCCFEHIDGVHHQLELHREAARRLPPPIGPKSKAVSKVN